MSSHLQTELKKLLREQCLLIIQGRINTLRVAMLSAQDAANEETKSSAGDKYETSRAMGHLEKDMYARQLTETSKELASLTNIDCDLIHTSVMPGSLVKCDTITYFILAGIGKIKINEETVYVISPNSPVSKLLIGKQSGDTVTINNKTLQIIEIS